MNRVEITTTGPVMENLCDVEVSDGYDSDTTCLDNADVESARAEGTDALIALVLDNCGGGTVDILRAALTNGTTVSLDGVDVPHDTLRSAMEPSETPAP